EDLGAEPERWILVRNEGERVPEDSVVPASDAHDEVERAARIAAGEEDREPRVDDDGEGREAEEQEHDVVRDREDPLDERKPAVQLALRVRIGHVERDALALVRRWIAVVEQREVYADAVQEPNQLEVPVEPPARILLTED